MFRRLSSNVTVGVISAAAGAGIYMQRHNDWTSICQESHPHQTTKEKNISVLATTTLNISNSETVKIDDDTAAAAAAKVFSGSEVEVDVDVEKDDWDESKENCPFCKFFMKSPCKLEFKKWSKCVDDAKAKDIDFVEACGVYTDALITCTITNKNYFEKEHDVEKNMEKGLESEDEDDANINNGAAVVLDAAASGVGDKE